MPVLGHSFVGLATGIVTQPAKTTSPSSRIPWSELWLPITVGLAYLPDIVAQLLLLTGWKEARLMSHSVIFAVIASAVIALLLSRMMSISLHRGFLISLFSILLHDLLDIAQSTDRVPWWPFSKSDVGFDLNFIPTDAFREALLFGSMFAVFLMIRYLILRSKMKGKNNLPELQVQTRLAWISRGAIVVIMLMAVIAHNLSDKREGQFDKARSLILHHEYKGALQILEQAERWPSTAKPGRIDYLRAEVYAERGDLQLAEYYYLRSYQADPEYFWCVADLAMLYASSPRPVSERRRLVAPYLNRLKSEFSDNKDLSRYLAKIEKKAGNTP